MKTSQEEKKFYQAIWFSEDDSEEPIVQGFDIEEIITKLLEITKEREGSIEVYKISYNDRVYKKQLYKKFVVLNNLQLYDYMTYDS